jgi:ABC-2 type transport system permease protein
VASVTRLCGSHRRWLCESSDHAADVLPPFWQKVSLFNPVVYLVSGFRWSFNEVADVSPRVSLAMAFAFLLLCLAVVAWIFKTGYKLKN